MMLRPALAKWYGAAVFVLLHFSSASPACAQLRPLDPLSWRSLQHAQTLHVSAGIGVFHDQLASRAGSSGWLFELGNFAVSWTTGRVMVEGSGTLVRRFMERRQELPRAEGVLASADAIRQDAGDFRLTTAVRLTPRNWSRVVALRFGTRLPTTDDRLGLDRDQTDFFALLGAHVPLLGAAPTHGAALFGEAGVSINGTRISDYEQADVLAYALGAEYRWRALAGHVLVTGQDDLRRRAVRGNEDLAELRAGIRIGDARWLRLSLVRGLSGFSPGGGLLIGVGARWHESARDGG